MMLTASIFDIIWLINFVEAGNWIDQQSVEERKFC